MAWRSACRKTERHMHVLRENIATCAVRNAARGGNVRGKYVWIARHDHVDVGIGPADVDVGQNGDCISWITSVEVVQEEDDAVEFHEVWYGRGCQLATLGFCRCRKRPNPPSGGAVSSRRENRGKDEPERSIYGDSLWLGPDLVL